MRVYEKCSNLKRQKTNLQHKQTTPLAYPPWVKSKFEANSHHSPPSFSVKQKERSSLSVHYNRWICIGRGLYLLPFDWLYYDMQSSVPEPRKKILDMQSSVPLLSCAAQARRSCLSWPCFAPHIQESRSYLTNPLFLDHTTPINCSLSQLQPNHPSSIHRDTSIAEDMNIELC